MFSFGLSKEQQIKLNEWLIEQNKKLIDEQRKSLSEDDFKRLTQDGKYPYTGAIGGGLTYKFTPTSLGVITVVELFGEEIDLTEYDMW